MPGPEDGCMQGWLGLLCRIVFLYELLAGVGGCIHSPFLCRGVFLWWFVCGFMLEK